MRSLDCSSYVTALVALEGTRRFENPQVVNLESCIICNSLESPVLVS